MIGEYKKILFDIFDVLGFSESEKERVAGIFKKKLTSELLKAVQGELPEDEQKWINEVMPTSSDPTDPKVLEIKNKIGELFSENDLYDRSRLAFKKIVADYVNFMSKDLDQGKISKIEEIVAKI